MKKLASRKELMRQLRYVRKTGHFWWRLRGSRRTLSQPAGSFDRKGYRSIKYKNVSYREHRLAWLFVKGVWPKKDIDHVDLNKGNNRWKNLCEATGSQNKQNGTKYRTNTSGFKGVHWDREARKWRAQIRVNKAGHTVGRFATPQQAHAAYVKAAKKHFGEFARAS